MKRKVALPDGKRVTAIDYAAEATGSWRVRPTLVLAHGAGADQEHSFMVDTARRLAHEGVRTVTFNFPYMQEGRKMPDRPPVLQAAFRAVVAEERERILSGGAGALFIGGKSLGGRMASHLAADAERDVLGVICLGYPLHPPGKPEVLRTKHLSSIRVPMLIVQGSRDPFGGPDEIRAHTGDVPAEVTLLPIVDGDHSFKVPKRVASADDVMRAVTGGIVGFMSRVIAAT